MGDIIEINGVKYKAKYTSDKISLKHYNGKYNIWVNLHFPKNSQAEGKIIEEDIIQILSSLYIERNTTTPSNTQNKRLSLM